MFDTLGATRSDALLALIGAFRADPRPQKIDIGVGVYRDDAGATPVMAAIREAERRLWESQVTKTYLGLLGDPGFNDQIGRVVLGPRQQALGARLRAVQTTGGCGALRALADLIQLARPGTRVWVSNPTWINHHVLLKAAGLDVADYPYVDPATHALTFDAMMDTLTRHAKAGDALLLHGVCHNPTGADLNDGQWKAVTDLVLDRGLMPLVDLAYCGLGRGLEADAAPVRELAARVPEMLLAVSCSKNFALYRDRVGCAMVIGSSPSSTENAFNHLLVALRASYSMPPDHGAAAVRIVLEDAALEQQWRDELESMRGRLASVRQGLVQAFRARVGDGRFDHIGNEYGLFSMLGIDAARTARLRDEHAVYMPADSRINVAGLRARDIEPFAGAVAAVL